ncbi:hypothetical protein FKP32DRAFT_1597532 [Trametes sanguinea]|nr:hypothetical protein FKP32DRAFT_1597532 [Trametes sanguinea]
MATTLNVAHVILHSYPETSPWELTPAICSLKPVEYGQPFPDQIKEAALVQAQQTKLNPFHFISWNNPLILEHPSLAQAHLPFSASPHPDSIPPLPRVQHESISSTSWEELHVGRSVAMFRVRQGDILCSKVLKLYLGTGQLERFSCEASAYARFALHNVASRTGAVPQCFGWVEFETSWLLEIITAPSSALQRAVLHHTPLVIKGLLLEDLSAAEPLTINNISLDVGDRALQSLHSIHAAYVLHNNISKDNVLVFTNTERVVWVGFSQSSYDGGPKVCSRQTLLAELAEGWFLMYQRLLPDAMIGWHAGADAIDPRIMCGPVVSQPIAPTRPHPSSLDLKTYMATILLSYPEVNLFSWDPPLPAISPPPRYDHQHDTSDFLEAVRDVAHKYETAPFYRWYGLPPFVINEWEDVAPDIIEPLNERNPPPPLPQLSSEIPIEVLEHVCPSSNHTLLRVRMGNEERLLKIFSKERHPQNNSYKSMKEHFEMERDAYAHLVHYGACEAGAVPFCYGWIELTPTVLYETISTIRRSHDAGVEELTWVSPIFEDGSWAAALVLEYLSNSQELHVQKNLTPHRADLALRSLSRVHGSYVLHRDIESLYNILLVPGQGSEPDRVVVIDFDHARTPQTPGYMNPLYSSHFRAELDCLFIRLYSHGLAHQRIYCDAPKHPHAVEF